MAPLKRTKCIRVTAGRWKIGPKRVIAKKARSVTRNDTKDRIANLEKALKEETKKRREQSRWSWWHWTKRKELMAKVAKMDKTVNELQRQVQRLSEGATHTMTLRPTKKVIYT